MLNVGLLKKLRKRFLRMRHAEHFHMDVIAIKTDCGSQMCIAGHALDLAGYTRRLRSEDNRSVVLDFNFISPSGRKIKNPLSRAAKEMGLHYQRRMDNKAYCLFHDSTITTPKEAAVRIQELIDGERVTSR